MSAPTQENVQPVKDFFAAMGGDKQGLLALAAENIEWLKNGAGTWDFALNVDFKAVGDGRMGQR